MRVSISDTAEYGDLTRGDRVVTAETKAAMRRILDDVRNGSFAREWIAEWDEGAPNFDRLRKTAAEDELEQVGERLRSMMPWLKK